jgi:hypothetical protein
MLHAVGETGGDESEARLLECFGRRGELRDDIAALPAFIEHALHALDLTGGSAQAFANIVYDIVGKLHLRTPLLVSGSGWRKAARSPVITTIPRRV